MKAKLTEESMCASLVEWLQNQHWEVYQEVQVGRGGPRADIVAVRGPVVWVIEAKLSLSLDLMAQAEGWTRKANLVSIAIPHSVKWNNRKFAARVLQMLGIGVLEIKQPWPGQPPMEMVDNCNGAPRLNRRARAEEIRDVLTPEHKTFAAAGNAKSQFYSPFKRTCQIIKDIVAKTPGLYFSDLMAQLKGRHHYSSDRSARGSLLGWIAEGKLPGIRLEPDGKQIRVFTDETTTNPKSTLA